MEQDVIIKALEKIRVCGAVALVAGDLKRSLLVRDALPRDIDNKELIQLGGVGDVVGHILDAEGRLLTHKINERVIGISLEDLTKIPNVILAAGGCHKVPIIRASLRNGFIDTLVTDEQTAEALLKD